MDVVAIRASRRLDIDCALGSSELQGEVRSNWCFCECPDCCTEPCWLTAVLSRDFEILEAEGGADDTWEQLGVPRCPEEGEGYSGL